MIVSTTSSEAIFLNNIKLMSLCPQFNLIIREIQFIFILSYEFISILESKVKNLVISVYLKGIFYQRLINSYKNLQFTTLMVYLLAINFKKEIQQFSQIIYTRQLLLTNKDYWILRS
jgi:hypothetical protein